MGHPGALNPASPHRSLGMGIRWRCGSQPPAGAEDCRAHRGRANSAEGLGCDSLSVAFTDRAMPAGATQAADAYAISTQATG